MICGHDGLGIGHHHLHHLEFFVGQIDVLCTAGKFKGLPVQREIPQRQHVRGKHFTAAACHGADTGQKLFCFKRLGKIIVRTGIQALDLVLKLGFCGKHDHRSGDPFRAKNAEDIKAVHLGHHDVQDQTVIVSRQSIIQGVLSVVDDIDGILIISEDHRQGIGEFLLIIR